MKVQQIKTVILTHPSDSGQILKDGLLSHGLNVIEDPMIDTVSIQLSLADITLIDEAEVLILTSKRGASELLEQCGADLLQGRFIVCIGTKTAQLFVLDLIYTLLVQKDPEAARANKLRTMDALSTLK